MEYIFLPLGIFLMIVGPRIILHGMFYNKYTQQWEGKKWQYYTAYAILQAIFFFLCTLPFASKTYIQIGNYFQLATGQKEFIECRKEQEELSEDLPDTEYIAAYAVRKYTPAEKILHEILPEIIKDQARFANWFIFHHHFDYKIEDYHIKYDVEKQLYQLYLGKEVAAEIEVKHKLFFKRIYFHGYWNAYPEYQNSQKEDSR